MKKVLLIFCVLLSTQGLAQLAAPLIDEDEFHPGVTWDVGVYRVTNTNAHSRGNLLINNVPSDLYVFTWDYAEEPLYPPEAGINVRQYAAGTSIQTGTAPLFEDYLMHSLGDFPSGTTRSSLEAGILREGGNTYIALSYYQTTWSGSTPVDRDVYLDLYEWNGGGGLTLISSENLSQQGDLPFEWVHLDVNNLTDLVVTWGQEDQIYTVGGTMSGGLQLSGIGVLEEGALSGYALGRPDVAMMRDGSGAISLYYVMTGGDVLFVTKGWFADLMAIPSGSVGPLPVELLDQQGASGTFIYDVARIDAPDNELYPGHEAWSYVVTEHYGDQDLVFTGSYSESVGLVHGYLNDGSTVPCGNCDISGNPTMDPDIYNQRAVVAYSDNGTDRFYAWCFRNLGWLSAFIPGEVTYVSVKTDANLNLLHTGIAQDSYFRIPDVPVNTSYCQAVGLSTQNDASPELFTAFIQWPDNPFTYEYYIGLKTVDWSTTTGFRPEAPVAILEADAPPTLQVYPNPFTTGFSMALDGGAKGEIYTLHIYDMLGRQMYSTEGTLTGINRLLKSQGENWPSGAYYLELRSKMEQLSYRQQLVKY